MTKCTKPEHEGLEVRYRDLLRTSTDHLMELMAERRALMAAVRAAADYDPGLWAYNPFADALPAHLRSEAEGKGKP